MGAVVVGAIRPGPGALGLVMAAGTVPGAVAWFAALAAGAGLVAVGLVCWRRAARQRTRTA